MLNVATLHESREHWEEAERLYAESADLHRRHMPKGHPGTYHSLTRYGNLLKNLERYEESESALIAAYEFIEDARGADHPLTMRVVKALVGLYDAWGRPDESAEWSGRLAGSGS